MIASRNSWCGGFKISGLLAVVLCLFSAFQAIVKSATAPSGRLLAVPSSYLGSSSVAPGPRVWHLVNEQPRPSPRFGFGAALDTVRKELVLQAGSQYAGVATDTWLRRNGNWTLIPTSPTPTSVYGMGMVYDAAHSETVLFGGLIFPGGLPGVTAETWTWNGTMWQKRDTPISPSARAWPAMVYDAVRREVVLFGGLKVDNVNGSQSLGDTWVWNGNAWTQRDTPVAPSPRYLCGMDYDPVRKETVLFGGNLELPGGQWSAETWSWDGAVWTRLSPTNSPEARSVGAFGIDPRTGTGVLFSGGALNGAFLDTWIWDGGNWTKVQPPHQPVSRTFSRIIYDAEAGKMLLLYGWNGNANLRDIWAWTGSDWVERTQPLEPSPRAYGNMCLDQQRHAALLFGGIGCDSILGETWSWDGNQWRQVFPQRAPSPRYGHALAYDVARDTVVLFGGQNANVLGDTWLWDGSNWSQVSGLILTPPARHHANMAYDSVRREIVLFGGEDSNGILLGDTWTWDGAQWNLQVPLAVPPTPRFRSAMAWDEATNAIIMFGGYDDMNGPLNDTWAWDGRTWTQLNPTDSPAPRYGHGIATDAATGHAILFRSPDSWMWDGTNWQQIDSPQMPSPRGASYFAADPTGTGVMLFGGPSIGYRDDTWRLAPNTAPSANDQSVQTGENTSLPIMLVATDKDGDLLSYTVTSQPSNGSLSGVPPNVIYAPAAGYIGPDAFSFSANDGFVASNVAIVNINVTPAPPLVRVVSQKVHSSAGTFDLDLPLTGSPGIECRSGAANGVYTLVFTFANMLTNVGGASVTSGIGSVSSSARGSDAHQYVVDLTGVSNAQYITVSLTNVTDSAGNFSSAVAASMGVLVGDVNGSGVVTSGDTNLCKAQALQPVTSANFRDDVNASGSITTGDVNIIKQNALSHL